MLTFLESLKLYYSTENDIFGNVHYVLTMPCLPEIFGGSCRITLVAALGYLAQIFGRWWRPTNGTF